MIPYLSRRRVQHPDVLRSQDMNQHTSLHVSYFDEAGLEGKDVRVEDGKRLRRALPRDLPVRTRPPTIAVDEEREVRVAEQELGREALDVDRLDVLAPCDEVQRSVGLVQQRLRLESLEGHNLEALGTTNAELGAQEMDRCRFGGNVEFL